jgi:hypothetical protein
MINFEADDLLGAWFYQDRGTRDWMLFLRRVPEGLELISRFRYYETEGAFDGLDRKNWSCRLLETTDPTKAIYNIRRMMVAVERKFGCEYKSELVRGNTSREEFLDRFKSLPYVHVMPAAGAQPSALRDPDGIGPRAWLDKAP